jgi:opacity protein-like surface antigen
VGTSETNRIGKLLSVPLGYSTFVYTPENKTNHPFRFGVSMGKTIQVSSLNALQLGLSYHYITQMDANGVLAQGVTPPYPQFNYRYSINSAQLLAAAKFLHQWNELYYPYLIGGIGAGFNKASNYSTSVPSYLTLTPDYSNKSSSSFSYSVGLGIDFFKFHPVTIGLGYRFSDLGQIRLGDGRIRNREISSQLGQSHLYLNTFLIEMTCYF